MLKKTIKYNDYNGEEREETFFFNLSKAEVTEMELSVDGGFGDRVKAIIAAKSTPEIIKIFKKLILEAYGEKTADGKRFRKIDDNGKPLYIAFSETDAYSILFMELATNDVAAAEFVNGVLPTNLDKEELQKAIDEAKSSIKE